ncbi:MAG: imidazole glycerol phosphate synthase subunit HisH [Candidatus Geothermincolales bacterium]
MAIYILDYGMGNLRSVEKAFDFLGYRCQVITSAEEAGEVDGIVLPGVGAFGKAVEELERRGYVDMVHECVGQGIPLLGICLGFQLLFEESEESPGIRGLGLFAGRVKRLAGRVKVPHMGWNDVRWVKEHPIIQGVKSGSFFYFVHSYHPVPEEDGVTLGITEYGTEFASAVSRGKTVGFQFHPEKSSAVGLRILRNFALMCSKGM